VSERDKAIARFCEVVADYGLPIPIDFQKGFDGSNRADASILPGSFDKRRVRRKIADIEHRPQQFGFR
jgi:hypothetical protein